MKDVWFLVLLEEVVAVYILVLVQEMARESVDSCDILSRVIERCVVGVVEQIMLVSIVRVSHW